MRRRDDTLFLITEATKSLPYFARVCSLISVLFTLMLSKGAAFAADPAEGPGDPVAGASNHLYNLEYEAARQGLETWLTSHPSDLRALNNLATVLLHREMFRHQILAARFYGDLGEGCRPGKVPVGPGFQKPFSGVLDKAQALAERRLKRDPNDQDAMYWAGQAHATRAVFYFAVLQAYLQALRESSQARSYHTRLLNMNPDYIDALLVIGTTEYVAGSLPWYLRVMASIRGFRGSRARGIEDVRRVAEQGHYAREDAKFALAIFYRREKRYPELLAVLHGLAESYPRNFLLRRQIAQLRQQLVNAKRAGTGNATLDGILSALPENSPDSSGAPDGALGP